MSLDPATIGVLVAAVVLAGVLIGILPVWRRAVGAGRRLPFWRFRRDAVAPVEGRAAFLAEVRCALCGEQAACLERLRTGIAQPPADCPNAALISSAARGPCSSASITSSS
jgi:hypothetical protein